MPAAARQWRICYVSVLHITPGVGLTSIASHNSDPAADPAHCAGHDATVHRHWHLHRQLDSECDHFSHLRIGHDFGGDDPLRGEQQRQHRVAVQDWCGRRAEPHDFGYGRYGNESPLRHHD